MRLLEHESLRDTRVLLVGQVGSKAYGTSTPDSDDDFMGVACARRSCYTGLDTWKSGGTLELKRAGREENDVVVYEVKKFFHLCLGFNPNVIPLLYLRPQDYKFLTNSGQHILDHRDMFVSRRALDTFVGYAQSQLSNVRRGVTGRYGEKRKSLIEKHGYDVKFAYHTIRLLGMIKEFFLTREMKVFRDGDVPLLMEIRQGKVPQTMFFKMAEHLIVEVQSAFEKATWVPDEPMYRVANRICMEVIEDNNY